MKNIRFTQSINLSVTIEASVPDDWTDEDIQEFTKECVVGITIDDPADHPDYNGNDVTFEEFSLDGAEITDAILWEGLSA